MSRCPRLLACLMGVLGMVMATGASAGRPPADRVWTRPGADRLPIRRIALLPVVPSGAPGGNSVGEQFLLHFFQDGHDWVPPEICESALRALAPHRPDSCLRAISGQVFRHGLPDTTAVPRIAQALRSQAVMTVRVDRWERVVESDARITNAHVELTASLVDSAGRVLWRISGRQSQTAKYGVPQVTRGAGGIGGGSTVVREYGGKRGAAGRYLSVPQFQLQSSPRVQGYTPPTGGVRNDLGADFEAALAALLERWWLEYPLARERVSASQVR